jgi:hypothetical protein
MLSLCMPWRRVGEWRYSSTCSWPQHWTLYHGGAIPRYSLNRRLGGTHGRSLRFGEEQNLFSLLAIEPQLLGRALHGLDRLILLVASAKRLIGSGTYPFLTGTGIPIFAPDSPIRLAGGIAACKILSSPLLLWRLINLCLYIYNTVCCEDRNVRFLLRPFHTAGTTTCQSRDCRVVLATCGYTFAR